MDGKNEKELISLKSYTALLAILWTLVVSLFMLFEASQIKAITKELAFAEAVTNFNKDKAFRFWGASHGGVYVPVSDKTPPNPYLSVSERDITTQSGKKLTLMNPSYMLRQLNEQFSELYGIKGHITSLKPLRPKNKPDEWERKALERFEKGDKEVYEFLEVGSKSYLRLIRPLIVEESCLKCHGHQGYSVGDIRGGIGILLPIEKYTNNERRNLICLGISFSIIWVLGLLGIVLGAKRVSYESAERKLASSANKAKSEFLANMSHEIRTPMNAILGFTDLLIEKSMTEEEQDDSLKLVRCSAENLLDIINDILDISKIESDKLFLENVNFDIVKLVSEIYNLIKIRLTGKPVELVTNIKGLPKTLNGDPVRFRQIIINLIGNACKFTESGKITLTGEVEKELEDSLILKFSVSDTGIGIPKNKLGGIFCSFSQADKSTARHFGGTGLGLSISKKLVEMMGGEIWVESAHGSGSTFYFTAKLKKAISCHTEEIIDTQPIARSSLDGIRILLVEDNKINQKLIIKMLSRLGCIVEVADDGLMAIEKVKASNYHVVLMDMQMPNMGGVEATQEIRKSHTDIPIIAMTANAMRKDRQECMDAGMNDYISKPVKKEKITTKILKWTNKG